VATINETIPGYIAVGWNGLMGPAPLPAPVLEKKNAAESKIVRLRELRDKLINTELHR